MSSKLPLVFACSGCSNAGKLADWLARELDRRGIAEMSCLAGVGAAKSHFLKQLADREVWVIDGCPIACSQGVFDQVRQQVNFHVRLAEFGVKKRAELPTEQELEALLQRILLAAESRNPSDGDVTPT